MYFFLLNDVFVTQLSSLSGGILFAVLTVLSYGAGYLLLARYAGYTDMQRKKFRHPTFWINVPRSKNHIFYYNLEDEVESMKHYLESIQEDIKKIKAPSNSNNIF
jgi:hypothetical protein